MASCCEDKSCEITALRDKHSRVLKVVLAINAGMFLVESTAGWLANSTSLMADSLDMLGDASVYGMSLYVLSQSLRQQAKVALAKGGFMLIFGMFVLADAAYKLIHPIMPNVQLMGAIGALALSANLICFFLLLTHREDNLNMSSTWLCSRNDLIANVGVLLAALTSYMMISKWPDIIVGVIIACLFLKSSWAVSKQALREMGEPEPAPKPEMKTVSIQFTKSNS